MKIGYARCSTAEQDLTVQRDALAALGVTPDRVYVDHGLTGTNRDRPGLANALAAAREGDELVVTKLDRLARSTRDLSTIADELEAGGVKLNIGGSIHDPTDPIGRLMFNVLAMIAEFEADLIRARTREGMRIAKMKGRLRGKQPKLKRSTAARMLAMLDERDEHGDRVHTAAEVAEEFDVGRSTLYREVERERSRVDAESKVAA